MTKISNKFQAQINYKSQINARSTQPSGTMVRVTCKIQCNTMWIFLSLTCEKEIKYEVLKYRQIKVKQGHFLTPFLYSNNKFALDASQYVVMYDFIYTGLMRDTLRKKTLKLLTQFMQYWTWPKGYMKQNKTNVFTLISFQGGCHCGLGRVAAFFC